MALKKRVRLVISGVVQGVFFRESARRRAEALGLTGWVRNQPDGSVEVVTEGDARDVDELVHWCHRGPMGAEVDEVSVVVEPYRGDVNRFAIRY
jgi:acylphosphatase